MTNISISEKAISFIVNEEVGSPAIYARRYTRPEWPRGASGITVGIGYDLGYRTKAEIQADWEGVLPQSIIEAMQDYVGLRGEQAHAYLAQARTRIEVPLEAAMQVFRERNLPYWIGLVRKALPNFDLLHGDCKGALVSLAYNRGAGGYALSRDNSQGSFREMIAIRGHMIRKEFDKIPNELRSMKRLWKMKGLLLRRDKEAKMFEEGLIAMQSNPPNLPETSGFF